MRFFCCLTDDFWSSKPGNTPGGVCVAVCPPTGVSLKYRDINSAPVIPHQLLWTGSLTRLWSRACHLHTSWLWSYQSLPICFLPCADHYVWLFFVSRLVAKVAHVSRFNIAIDQVKLSSLRMQIEFSTLQIQMEINTILVKTNRLCYTTKISF